MEAITLKEATAADIESIQRLAKSIWNAHYPGIITQEQIDYMLNKMYSTNAIQEQLNAGQQFYLVQLQAAAIGFVSISITKDKVALLHKFYLAATAQRKGIGEKTFAHLTRLLPDVNQMELTVNRQNYKSINFYFKLGFSIKEVADFDIGNGYVMNDFVMCWHRKNNLPNLL